MKKVFAFIALIMLSGTAVPVIEFPPAAFRSSSQYHQTLIAQHSRAYQLLQEAIKDGNDTNEKKSRIAKAQKALSEAQSTVLAFEKLMSSPS